MKFSVCAIDRDLSPDIPFPLRGKSYEECAALASRLGFDGYEDILTDSVSRVLEYAEGIRTPMVMEQINRRDGDVFCSTDRTMRFLEKFHSDWLVYNGDTYHMLSEDPDIPAAIRRSLSKLVLFHVSDENRALPDDRHFNFHEAATVLKESGYDKWVSIECKPLPNSAEATRQGYAYLKRVFG